MSTDDSNLNYPINQANYHTFPWDNRFYPYHLDFSKNDFGRSNSAGNHMGNLVPWLLSMSLLGVQEFAAHSGPESLSQELQAPSFPELSFPSLSGLSSPSDSYENPSSASYDSCLGQANCRIDLHDKDVLHRSLPIPLDQDQYLRLLESNRVVERPIGRSISNSNFGSRNRYDFNNWVHGSARLENEYVGPAMELVYSWTVVDFEFVSIEARDDAIFQGEFIAENNLPLGLDVWGDKVFVTLPRWKDGIPATLATVPRHSRSKSPKLKPYPGWEWHRVGKCDNLNSVFRIQVDECDRLWVLDSARIEVALKPKDVCPPAVFIFDLRNNDLIRKYSLPDDQVKQDSLFSNIVVDVRDGDCGGAVAYLSDVWRFGLVVYDFYKDTSFRIDHHLFFPDPLASRYDLHGIKFRWTDGLFGLALTPVDINNDKTLFFHPMSSFREFAVSTTVLKDKKTADQNPDRFSVVGRPRAKDYGHSSGSVIDKNGVMFFNMVTRDSVWCWDTRKEYIPQNLGVVGTSNVSLVFPNDIKADHEDPQSVWLISNRLPMYLYGRFDPTSTNFRIYKADVNEAVKNTVCDPNYVVPDSDQRYDEDF
ncbi:dopaminechrome tautomerase-like [Prorops nasuta]|uniref:dopaminechrome tautomerase-like n=1 Tax=Prorops nasuta TaxID=863751 RepID=UPI0034D01C6E